MRGRVERWSDGAEVAQITKLLCAAYAELAAMGFRYVATHQGDAVTKTRLQRGESFIAGGGDVGGRIVGTINLCPPGLSDRAAW